MSLNNAQAPSFDEIFTTCVDLQNEDDILDYLSEVASNDFQCPDKCDQWAMEFLEENEDDIMTAIAEKAHERQLEDFYGGSSSVKSLDQQMAEARKLK